MLFSLLPQPSSVRRTCATRPAYLLAQLRPALTMTLIMTQSSALASPRAACVQRGPFSTDHTQPSAFLQKSAVSVCLLISKGQQAHKHD